MNFKDELQNKQIFVNDILLKYLPNSSFGYDKVIFEAMKYSLLAGGKRIRPILMMQAFEICKGQDVKQIESYMVAMEMIHTYSLIHDDLPAMDDDDYRRGMLTCHKKFSEDIAILAGDALLNNAYEIMIKNSLEESEIIANNKLLAMKEIGTAAGVRGMIGGQVVDVIDKEDVNLDIINYIHIHKTSAIIEASLTSGALLANASCEEVETFRKIGRCIGLAFQIQDDILDITSTEDELGKPIGSDCKNGKKTYVTIKGIKQSKEKVNELIDEALQYLDNFNNSKTEFLYQFILYLRDRKK